MSVSDTGSAPSLIVRSARFSYGGAPLFSDLNFDVAGGCWTCLLGPSGIGKSSLLRLIAQLLEPERGTRIEAGDERPVAGRIAFLAQRDSLMPWLSAIDNVTLGYRVRGQPVDRAERERAERLLQVVGLKDRMHSRPDSLSGGERQRVALARTLMEDRPIVLMDEPFSALDAINRYRIQNLAVQLLHGRTVLMVTHDPLEALRLGDAVHVMAGFPAHLDDALRPPGEAPRDPTAHEIADLHHDLLERLSAAKGSER